MQNRLLNLVTCKIVYLQIGLQSMFYLLQNRQAILLCTNKLSDYHTFTYYCKIKCIEVAIECAHALQLEVGSYALMHDTGFELFDMLLCCKFAEGDSRILMLKMARDRLSKYQRKMKKGDDSSSSGTTDDLEDEQCRIIMDTMKAADGAANNVGTYKEMNKLAEMTMERILTQYSGK